MSSLESGGNKSQDECIEHCLHVLSRNSAKNGVGDILQNGSNDYLNYSVCQLMLHNLYRQSLTSLTPTSCLGRMYMLSSSESPLIVL